MDRSELDDTVRRHLDAGDTHGALTVALRGLGPELLGFLCVLVKDQNEAGEVFADVCVRMWKSLPGFRWESSLRTWAYVVARRAFLVHVQRRASWREHHVALSGVPEDISALVAKMRTSTISAIRKDQRTRIERLRDTLPADDQALLTLRIDRGLEWRDIACVLADRDDLGPAELTRAAAGLRKRFERLKVSLRKLVADDEAKS